MKYQIPVSNLEKLEKKINRIIKKGGPIVFKVGDDCKIPYKPDERLDTVLYIKAKEVEVEGEYIINGWRFAATIEHKDNGNIVRCIDPSLEGKIPERYWTCRPHCDHCNQDRNRKDTYLIVNEESGEFKQVGKSCLMEYTNGLSAELCAEICSSIDICEDCSKVDEDDIFFRGPSCPYVPSEIIKKVSYPHVKEEGYKPHYTAEVISNMVFTGRKRDDSPVDYAEDAEIAEVDAWVKALNADNDYLRNAKTAWESEYSEYRDIALISSLINSFFKEKNRRQAIEKSKEGLLNEHMGNVGDKVIFKVTSVRTLYSKGSYSYYGPEVRVLEIHDEKGHTILWSTSSYVHEGDIIQAKVKSLGEYRGMRQTVVTRGSFLFHSSIGEGEYEDESEWEAAGKKANKALDAFLSILEH